MKKAVLVAVVGLILAGFGCQTKPEGPIQTAPDGTMLKPTETVEGVWFLNFDLPTGWAMVPEYDEADTAAPTEAAVTNQMTDVVLQSTESTIDLDGENVKEGAVTEGFLYARVYRMDKRTGIPEGAEDMGNGFYRVNKGVTVTYYFQGNLATYKFVVYWNNRELSEFEEVIMTAQEVTNFQNQE